MKKLIFIVLISFALIACESKPKNQLIELTYLVKDKSLFYNRESGSILLNEKPKVKVYATVTNTSDFGGVFKLYAKMSSQGNVIEFEDEEYIESGKTVILEDIIKVDHYSFDENVKIDEWKIIAPVKVITLSN